MNNNLIYLDAETTGLKDCKIISIQYQNIYNNEIHICKTWNNLYQELPEINAINEFKDFLNINYYSVLMGLNIDSFDIPLIKKRFGYYAYGFNHYGFTIDFKHILILMNNLEFKGWNKILNPNKQSGSIIPKLYEEKRYKEIENYIIEESKNTVDGIRKIIDYFKTQYPIFTHFHAPLTIS